MAFYNWVEQINISNVLDETSFSNETSRKTGFRPNELTNADIVNSGLRQANLISVALMNSLNITNRNLQSSVEDVSNDITNKLNNIE